MCQSVVELTQYQELLGQHKNVMNEISTCVEILPKDGVNSKGIVYARLMKLVQEKVLDSSDVIPIPDSIYSGLCPNCESLVGSGWNEKYCGKCGMPLRWWWNPNQDE